MSFIMMIYWEEIFATIAIFSCAALCSISSVFPVFSVAAVDFDSFLLNLLLYL